VTAVQRTKHPRTVLTVTGAAWTLLWVTLGSLSDWGAYWIAWIVAGFLVPELYGLATNTARTLSRNTWALEHLDFGHPLDFAEWTPLHWMIAVVVWLLFGWLSMHIPFAYLR
jgi:hypothetical protein